MYVLYLSKLLNTAMVANTYLVQYSRFLAANFLTNMLLLTFFKSYTFLYKIYSRQILNLG